LIDFVDKSVNLIDKSTKTRKCRNEEMGKLKSKQKNGKGGIEIEAEK
jgi:hypothetical protein